MIGLKSLKNHARDYRDLSLKDELPFDIEYYQQLLDNLNVDDKNKTLKKKQLMRVWRHMP